MDILKTIARANALLLQGAYQVAEHVLDVAIVDARALIYENSELKQQITAYDIAFDNMAAEREQLLAQVFVCDKTPQEIHAILNFQSTKTDLWEDEAQVVPAQQVQNKIELLQRLCDAKGRDIAAITAENVKLVEKVQILQSSPAVAVPDYKEELFKIRQQAENWSTKLGFITSAINSRKISLSDKEREFPHLLIERLHTDSELFKQRSPSPRITEQDAREIIETYAYWEEFESHIDSGVDQWLKEASGRALLNKLNAKPESNAPSINPVLEFIALADELIESHPYLYAEIARTRTTDWMAHLRARPNGEFLATSGQAGSAAEACQQIIDNFNSMPESVGG